MELLFIVNYVNRSLVTLWICYTVYIDKNYIMNLTTILIFWRSHSICLKFQNGGVCDQKVNWRSSNGRTIYKPTGEDVNFNDKSPIIMKKLLSLGLRETEWTF